jgi:hypothetical protein
MERELGREKWKELKKELEAQKEWSKMSFEGIWKLQGVWKEFLKNEMGVACHREMIRDK